MRIGLFSDTYEPEINGVASSVLTLENELVKNGHEVYVITTHHNLLKKTWDHNVLRLPGVELKSLYGYVASPPIHIFALDEIEKLNLDIIHAHTEFGVGVFARICAKRLQIPLVSTFHTTYEDYTHYVNRFNFDTVEAITRKTIGAIRKFYADSSVYIISPSIKTKQLIEQYDIKTNIKVIPTGLNLQKFNSNNITKERILEVRNECQLKEDEKAILYVGRIAKEKSIDKLIEGFSHLRDEKVKLVIVGSGPDQEALEDKTAKLKLEDKVVFLGPKPRGIVQEYYLSLDAFASASLSETQGLTYIEALACSLPVFACDKEVIGEYVHEGKNGFFFETAQEFADKVKAYLQITNLEDVREYCKNSIKHFDLKTFYESVMMVYMDSINEYKNYYTIKDINVTGDVVKLQIEKDNNIDKYTIFMDTFFELKLRVKETIYDTVYQEIIKDSKVCEGYLKCIKKLNYKDRTIKEMYDFLNHEEDLDIKTINFIIQKLEERGYINDERYAQSYVSNAIKSLKGKKNIDYSLRKLGVDYEIIERVLNDTNLDVNDELAYAIKYAKKQLNSNRNKSQLQFTETLKSKMYARGYNSIIVNKAIKELDFYELENNEIEILRKEAQKLFNRKRNKLTGTKLRNYVFNNLVSKGFDYKDIYLVINEME